MNQGLLQNSLSTIKYAHKSVPEKSRMLLSRADFHCLFKFLVQIAFAFSFSNSPWFLQIIDYFPLPPG